MIDLGRVADGSYQAHQVEWLATFQPRLNDEKLAEAKRGLYQAIVGALRPEGLSAQNIANLLAEQNNLSYGKARHIPDLTPGIDRRLPKC